MSIVILHIIYTWIFLQVSPPKFSMHFSRTYGNCSCHLIILDLITQMIFCGTTPWTSSVCTVLHAPATSSLASTNIFSNILFSNTFSLCSSLLERLNMEDEMGKRCEPLGRYHNCIQSFVRKTRKTETIWKTKARKKELANITKYVKRLSGCSATCFGYKCTTFAGHIMPGLEPMRSCHL